MIDEQRTVKGWARFRSALFMGLTYRQQAEDGLAQLKNTHTLSYHTVHQGRNAFARLPTEDGPGRRLVPSRRTDLSGREEQTSRCPDYGGKGNGILP